MKGVRVYTIEVAVFADFERCTPSSIADIPAGIPLNDTSVKSDGLREPSTYWSKLGFDHSHWKAVFVSEIGVASRAEFDCLLKGIFVYTDLEATLFLVQWLLASSDCAAPAISSLLRGADYIAVVCVSVPPSVVSGSLFQSRSSSMNHLANLSTSMLAPRHALLDVLCGTPGLIGEHGRGGSRRELRRYSRLARAADRFSRHTKLFLRSLATSVDYWFERPCNRRLGSCLGLSSGSVSGEPAYALLQASRSSPTSESPFLRLVITAFVHLSIHSSNGVGQSGTPMRKLFIAILPGCCITDTCYFDTWPCWELSAAIISFCQEPWTRVHQERYNQADLKH